jgi:hypothetical protein
MALLRTRKQLVKDLRIGIRLLLPEDPGRDQIVEVARLFNPHARVALGRIEVDPQREIHIVGPDPIDASIAAEAQTPPGMTVAYFAQYTAGDLSERRFPGAKRKRGYQAMMLMYGMAVRLGGRAWPEPDEVREPLCVHVFTPQTIQPQSLDELLARSPAGLLPIADPWDSIGARSWRSGNSHFEAKFRPPGVQTTDPPPSLGELSFHSAELSALTVRVCQPAYSVDYATAYAAGETALAAASAVSGIATDLFGFRLLQPDDMVFRQLRSQKMLSQMCSAVCPTPIAAALASLPVANSACPMP